MQSGRILALLFLSLFLINPAVADDIKLNQAEQKYLEQSQYQLQYANENVPIIEVENTVELGKLAALSFLDWVIQNPEGVIALPSGKTPEYFIKFLAYYKENWHKKSTQDELQSYGIHSANFPNTSQLKFVQLDEFFGLASNHQRSFNQYVKNYYVKTLNLQPENLLLIDLAKHHSLANLDIKRIFPSGKIDLELVDHKAVNKNQLRQQQVLKDALAYCKHYEKKIRDWGGIGFFIGGIGHDGHIAFNLPGVNATSPTHLTQLNYQTSAQSAVDLGGMQHAQGQTVITIGLGTLKYKPDAKIIIMAAGEIKAPIVKQAVEGPATNKIPASLLQDFNNTTFYLTQGASSQLSARKAQKIRNFDQAIAYQTVVDTALHQQKRILDLKSIDFSNTLEGRALNKTYPNLQPLLVKVDGTIKENINNSLGKLNNQTFLHTAPHHDDVMLSYYPLMNQLLQTKDNTLAYLTSGFNSVTDDYVIEAIDKLNQVPQSEVEQIVFKDDYATLLKTFGNAFNNHDQAALERLEPFFVYHKIKEAFLLKSYAAFVKRADKIKATLKDKTPGNKDIAPIQLVKGMIRESEADRLWAIHDVKQHQIKHLRSKFYTGAIFDPIPNIKDDARPVLKLYKQLNPDVITVALDPEGTGPDTHYKVLQVVAQALKLSNDFNPKVWGYRNVWYRFGYTDANLFIPVQYKQLLEQDEAFMSAFATQRTAAFPSPYFEGTFSKLSEKIQRSQYEDLKVLLGKNFFETHPNHLVRNASGFVMLKQMPAEQFMAYADDLKNKTQLDIKQLT